ncbi:hypothetical protein R80B4_00646 [Fibrobacteres bacterium R8-0-B4]
MQIAIEVPPEKTDFLIEVLKSFPFVKGISTNASEETVQGSKRKIGLLNGVGDVVFKDDWEMTEEELLEMK